MGCDCSASFYERHDRRCASRASNRPVSEGPEVPMHPSDSPADRRDQENRAPAETPPSPGAVGQGKLYKPKIAMVEGEWTIYFSLPADREAFYEWREGVRWP